MTSNHETESATRRPLWQRAVPVAALVAAAGAAIALDLHTYLSFDTLREHRAELTAFVERNGAIAALVYMAVYSASTALSLPGGAVLSITGGFLFGGLLGGAYVVVGATIGATLVFLAARTVLGDVLRERAGPWLKRMQAGFQRDALSYLLTLRLIPLFPFFVVNLVPAFLGVPLRTYVVATGLGIVPGALVFTFAGAGIGSVLDSPDGFSVSGILTPQVVGALVGLGLLSLLPVVYKRVQARRSSSATAVAETVSTETATTETAR